MDFDEHIINKLSYQELATICAQRIKQESEFKSQNPGGLLRNFGNVGIRE
jgi:hypothetical protein